MNRRFSEAMAINSQFHYDLPKVNDSGTHPAGRPQPGAGNAGDQDRPRKSPAGPMTTVKKSALATTNKAVGKRAAAKKVSTARGRKAVRAGQMKMGSSSLVGKKRIRKKKKDSGGTKRRVR